ncbi:MAG: shikimate kinase AroK [Chlamydiia bacterium]|nr:shikimate kinase AroK [Chlamydiia bacterium]MCP5509678.1 shikimate kinase AroK [Chlamydiales bacterium]
MFVLFGAPGAGKSTLGQALAQKLNLPLFDVDQMIEDKTGFKRDELWKRAGERYYRSIESSVVYELKTGVVACGGGTVLNQDNLAHLQTHGQMIYLFCPVEVLLKRFFNSPRALLQTEPELRKLLEQRIPIYEKIEAKRIDSSQSIEKQLEALVHE